MIIVHIIYSMILLILSNFFFIIITYLVPVPDITMILNIILYQTVTVDALIFCIVSSSLEYSWLGVAIFKTAILYYTIRAIIYFSIPAVL